MNSDLKIAQEAKMLDISEIANKLNLDRNDYEFYGNYKAKISLNVLEKNKDKKDGKVILVTAINPTKAGEGKSTTTVGLTQAIAKLGKNVIATLREPSFGPVLGLKGGAAGGGYSQVLPMEDINLHFTGDIHAITTANNAVSALIDNHIHQGNILNIDPRRIVWKRCLDMNDRALRNIVIGMGGPTSGVPREDGFDITVASEIMAVLCLASSIDDLKNRIDRIVVAYTYDKLPITIKDLEITGSLAVILKEAMKPNLVQTIENTPVLIHGGPFANIAHGCNSLIATHMGMKLSDYVVTEAGFGADLGAEKFFNIKSRFGKINPACTVIVATIKALKMHGGVDAKMLKQENVTAMLSGCENLKKHIETIEEFGVPYVIAINKFVTDSDDEINELKKWCESNNYPISLSEAWEHGGDGAIDLANKVLKICDAEKSNFKPLYDLEDSIENKINIISKKCYGAEGVEFSIKAKRQISEYNKLGWSNLAICMAKTPASLSDNPKLIGRPNNFRININELRISKGAGFIVALSGSVMTMPGLPKQPSALKIDINNNIVEGLF